LVGKVSKTPPSKEGEKKRIQKGRIVSEEGDHRRGKSGTNH